MTYVHHWPKAMAVSVFLHVLILVTVGYLGAGLLTELPPPEEKLLEMDLVSIPAASAGNTPEPAQQEAAPTVPSTPAPPETVIPVAEPEPSPVVTSDALTMTEAEIPVLAPAAGPPSVAKASATAGTGAPVTGGGVQSGVAAPAILSKVDPAYPQTARKAGQEGTALLRIQILSSGRPGEITLERSTGYAALDASAVAAVSKWQFVPAKDRSTGRAVACTTTLPVSFRLH